MRKIGQLNGSPMSLLLLEEKIAKQHGLEIWKCCCGLEFATVGYASFHVEKHHPSIGFKEAIRVKEDFATSSMAWNLFYSDVSENVYAQISSESMDLTQSVPSSSVRKDTAPQCNQSAPVNVPVVQQNRLEEKTKTTEQYTLRIPSLVPVKEEPKAVETAPPPKKIKLEPVEIAEKTTHAPQLTPAATENGWITVKVEPMTENTPCAPLEASTEENGPERMEMSSESSLNRQSSARTVSTSCSSSSTSNERIGPPLACMSARRSFWPSSDKMAAKESSKKKKERPIARTPSSKTPSRESSARTVSTSCSSSSTSNERFHVGPPIACISARRSFWPSCDKPKKKKKRPIARTPSAKTPSTESAPRNIQPSIKRLPRIPKKSASPTSPPLPPPEPKLSLERRDVPPVRFERQTGPPARPESRPAFAAPHFEPLRPPPIPYPDFCHLYARHLLFDPSGRPTPLQINLWTDYETHVARHNLHPKQALDMWMHQFAYGRHPRP